MTLSTSLFASDAAESESWYFNFGTGLSSITYDTNTQNVLNLLSDNGLDILIDIGAYWPLGNKTLLGVSFTNVIDRYSFGSTYEVDLAHNQSSLSTIHFFDGIGTQGPYIRADIGSAKLTLTETLFNTTTTSTGNGVAFGGGYTLPLKSGKTRVMFGLLARGSTVDDEEVSDISAEVSWLF